VFYSVVYSSENIKQFERKRDLHTTFILVHSIPKLLPVLRQTYEFPLVINTDYNHISQRGDFESHKAYSPALQNFTPQDKTTSIFTGFQT